MRLQQLRLETQWEEAAVTVHRQQPTCCQQDRKAQNTYPPPQHRAVLSSSRSINGLKRGMLQTCVSCKWQNAFGASFPNTVVPRLQKNLHTFNKTGYILCTQQRANMLWIISECKTWGNREIKNDTSSYWTYLDIARLLYSIFSRKKTFSQHRVLWIAAETCISSRFRHSKQWTSAKHPNPAQCHVLELLD